MKYTFALLILSMPTAAIADNLPANFMEWRGKIYNLNHLWGQGVVPTQTATVAQPTVSVPVQTESREVRDNKQRVEYENARAAIRLERILNSK